MAGREKIIQTVERLLTVLFAAGAAFVAGHLLYSAWCAFTWSKFTMFDYGIYTNMIWNSAHGAPFKVLVNDTYLSTHLSFTLALLGPFFWIADNPFLLSFLQWLMMLIGGLIILSAAVRSKVPAVMTAALLFFWVGYRFTQGLLLSEFHGVGVYYLLVPWLYYYCSFSKGRAWLPLVFILGVREDAFIFILPLLLYFAVKDKWKTGYILAGLAVLYGAFAIFYLYPQINGLSLFDRRGSVLKIGHKGSNELRMFSLLWTFLPVLVTVHRKSLAAILFPLFAILSVLASGYPTQQGMGSHYGANVMVCLAMGILEVFVLRCRAGGLAYVQRSDITLRAIMLSIVVVLLHFNSGFICMGGKGDKIYREQCMRGLVALPASRHISKHGILVTQHNLVGFCANRSDVLTWERLRPERDDFDVVFLEARYLNSEYDGKLWQWLEKGEWGVSYFDGEYLIMQKGYDAVSNPYVMDRLRYGTVYFALTPKHGGKDVQMNDGRWVRYWLGKGHRAPITLSFGGNKHLEAGEYSAIFSFRADRPERKCQDNWGWFSVHRLNDGGPPLARQEIMNVAVPSGEYLQQTIKFKVRVPSRIEPRVTGGDAKLWLDQVFFIKNEN